MATKDEYEILGGLDRGVPRTFRRRAAPAPTLDQPLRFDTLLSFGPVAIAPGESVRLDLEAHHAFVPHRWSYIGPARTFLLQQCRVNDSGIWPTYRAAYEGIEPEQFAPLGLVVPAATADLLVAVDLLQQHGIEIADAPLRALLGRQVLPQTIAAWLRNFGPVLVLREGHQLSLDVYNRTQTAADFAILLYADRVRS